MASSSADRVTTIISVENVCFSYGDQEVLHDISFVVEKNMFLGIVGPNGGGKTTLLRLIIGIEKPGRGIISVFEKKPVAARARVGYVMQQMHFDDRFPATVMDIVLMGRVGRHILGPYSSLDRDHAREALTRVGMEQFRSRPFPKLSGGQRQRVLIAQALAGEPDLLLLDEPTANIDSEGEAAVNTLLQNLAKTVTIVMVSHNINTVLDCASHVLCVNRTSAMNALADMHPELVSRARGGGIAVLHHELSCRIFNKQSGGACADGCRDENGGVA